MLCHLLTKLELTASASMAQRLTDDKVFQWANIVLNEKCMCWCFIDYKVCFHLLYTFAYNVFFRRIHGDNIINLHNLHVKYLSFLSDLNYTLLFHSIDFLKVITNRIL